MSFLSKIHTYWAGNSTLTSALAATKVWTGLAPENTAFPYAVITSIGLQPEYTSCTKYYATFTFQVSIFDTDPDNAESIAATVAGQFAYQSISTNCLSCLITNGPILLVDPDSPKLVYHCLIEFEYLESFSLPDS